MKLKQPKKSELEIGKKEKALQWSLNLVREKAILSVAFERILLI